MHVSTHSEGGNEGEGVRGEQGGTCHLAAGLGPIGCLRLCGCRRFFATRNKQPMATNVFNMFLEKLKKPGWCGSLGLGLKSGESYLSLNNFSTPKPAHRRPLRPVSGH